MKIKDLSEGIEEQVLNREINIFYDPLDETDLEGRAIVQEILSLHGFCDSYVQCRARVSFVNGTKNICKRNFIITKRGGK